MNSSISITSRPGSVRSGSRRSRAKKVTSSSTASTTSISTASISTMPTAGALDPAHDEGLEDVDEDRLAGLRRDDEEDTNPGLEEEEDDLDEEEDDSEEEDEVEELDDEEGSSVVSDDLVSFASSENPATVATASSVTSGALQGETRRKLDVAMLFAEQRRFEQTSDDKVKVSVALDRGPPLEVFVPVSSQGLLEYRCDGNLQAICASGVLRVTVDSSAKGLRHEVEGAFTLRETVNLDAWTELNFVHAADDEQRWQFTGFTIRVPDHASLPAQTQPEPQAQAQAQLQVQQTQAPVPMPAPVPVPAQTFNTAQTQPPAMPPMGMPAATQPVLQQPPTVVCNTPGLDSVASMESNPAVLPSIHQGGMRGPPGFIPMQQPPMPPGMQSPPLPPMISPVQAGEAGVAPMYPMPAMMQQHPQAPQPQPGPVNPANAAAAAAAAAAHQHAMMWYPYPPPGGMPGTNPGGAPFFMYMPSGDAYAQLPPMYATGPDLAHAQAQAQAHHMQQHHQHMAMMQMPECALASPPGSSFSVSSESASSTLEMLISQFKMPLQDIFMTPEGRARVMDMLRRGDDVELASEIMDRMGACVGVLLTDRYASQIVLEMLRGGSQEDRERLVGLLEFSVPVLMSSTVACNVLLAALKDMHDNKTGEKLLDVILDNVDATELLVHPRALMLAMATCPDGNERVRAALSAAANPVQLATSRFESSRKMVDAKFVDPAYVHLLAHHVLGHVVLTRSPELREACIERLDLVSLSKHTPAGSKVVQALLDESSTALRVAKIIADEAASLVFDQEAAPLAEQALHILEKKGKLSKQQQALLALFSPSP